jgi:hypothetical protein
MTRHDKLECLSLETLSSQVIEFDGKARANPNGPPFICFFSGKLLVLPANVRPNTLAYLASSSAMKKKSFITLVPGVIVIKTIFSLLMVSNIVFSQDIFVELGPIL